MKLKQESSGYPQNVKSEEEKQAYIDQYLDHEGILLEKECIDKNAGLRSLSKLVLNSFYGKFGQRTNMKKTLFVKDIKQLMQVLTDPGKLSMDFHIMNDDVIQVEYKNTEDFECQSVIVGSSRQSLKVREVKCIPGDPATMCPVLFKGSRSLLLLV